MKLLDLLFRRETGSSGTTTTTTETSGSTNWMEAVTFGASPTAAMKVAAVYRCVNLISDSIAVMPLLLKSYNPSARIYEEFSKHDPEHLNYLFNVRPNYKMNGFAFKKALVQQLLLKGNAIVLCRDQFGHIVKPSEGLTYELVLLVDKPVYDPRTGHYHVNDSYWGISATLTPDDVIHIKNCTNDGGGWGESTISRAARTLSLSSTAEERALQSFATGGRGKYILGSKSEVSGVGTRYNKSQMTNAATTLEQDLATKDIVTMPDQSLQLYPISMSASEQQFVENRKISLYDIARWFNVPPCKLGEVSSNYKSTDAAQVDFYTEALQPICSQIETEFLAKITDRSCWFSYKLDFDERPLFQLDRESAAKWMKARLETGVDTVNSLRAEMDRPPIDGGDTVFLSANYKSIDMLIKEGGKPAAEPTPKKEDEV